VISGAESDALAAAAELEARGIETKRLAIPLAAHSPLVDSMLEEFERVAASITYHPPERAIISTVDPHGEARMDSPQYWVDNVRQTVRFAEGMSALEAAGVRTYVELGPKSTLLGAGRGCVSDDASVTWLPTFRKDTDDWPSVMSTLAKWYVLGGAVDWAGVTSLFGGEDVDLPTYAFQRRRFWLEVSPRPSNGGGLVRAVGDVEDSTDAAAPPSAQVLRDELIALSGLERLQAVTVAIQEAVARILGLRSAKDVPCEVPLNDIGFDSLLGIELRNQLSALIDAPLSADVVLANPTVADQAAFISVRLGDLDAAERERRRIAAPLVPLRRGGDGPPLFLVHPFYGGVEVFAPLVQQLPPTRPVYALRARGVAPGESPHSGMDEITDAYLAALKTVQSEGPYTVAGYSAGGVIAYELTRKLEASGQQVQLALLDTWTFAAMRELSGTMAFAPGEASALLLTAFAHGCDVPLPNEALDADEARRLIDEALERGSLPLTRDDIEQRAKVSVAVIAALLSVDIDSPPIAASILAVHSSETTDDYALLPVSDSAAARSVRWARHTSGTVSTKIVPGDHLSMMAEPHVLAVAAALTDLEEG